MQRHKIHQFRFVRKLNFSPKNLFFRKRDTDKSILNLDTKKPLTRGFHQNH